MKIAQLSALETYLDRHKPAISLFMDRDAVPYLEHALGLRATKISNEVAFGELETSSLLGEQRLLWIADPGKWIFDYCKRPNPNVFLVITAKSPSTELCSACNLIFDPPKLPPWREEEERTAWIIDVAKGAIQPDAAAALARTSSDRGQLRLELEKLLCFRNPVDMGAVRALVPQAQTETVWDLSRAIMERRAGRALHLYHELQETPHALLAMLRSQIQQGLRILSMLAHEENITKAFPYLKGKNLQRRIDQVRAYGEKRLRSALVALQRTDLEAKSGSNPEFLVELLIARIAA